MLAEFICGDRKLAICFLEAERAVIGFLMCAMTVVLIHPVARAGTFDGPAELPRIFLDSTMANTPAPGSTIHVAAGASLQAVLNGAQCGDTVSLQAGALYQGSFALPAKGCDSQHWIIVRTDAPDASLPPEGQRITPCYAGISSLSGRPAFPCPRPQNVLATVQANNVQAAFRIAPGANYYRLLGLEITRAANGKGFFGLVQVQNGQADHIVIDRSWLHGTTHEDTAVGVALRGGTYFSIVDSYFSDFHCTEIVGICSDAQAIGGGNGKYPGGPYQIVDNFLEAAGENILFGGGAATTTPADIEIRRNHFFKPLLWMRGQPGFIGGVNGNAFVVKNHLELKNAQRVLVEANVFEYTWGGFSQNGFSILLTPKNQFSSKTGQNVCPSCQVTDVTIRYSTISHVGVGIEIGTIFSDGAGAALAGERFSVHDITVDDVSRTKYLGGGSFMALLNQWATNPLNQLTVNHVTAFPDPNVHILSVGDKVSNPKMSGFVFTNNIVGAAKFPVWSAFSQPDCSGADLPLPVLQSCFSSYAFNHNALIGVPPGYPSPVWPTGNSFPISVASVQFVNYNNADGGDYQLLPSSPYKNAGSDGKDMGADVAAIQAAITGVY
ncbi:MAG: hypothetical protein JOZ36_17220 [Acidobacteria bacterium]|nr:hypothetical protein [Acidobacteriota bacterium]